MAKRILIADDSVTIQKAFAMTFAGEDVSIASARSADEGLALARQARPDLIIADGAMPGRTGYDLCAQVRADATLSGVPVYILASSQQPYDEARGTRRAGRTATCSSPGTPRRSWRRSTPLLAPPPRSLPRPPAPPARTSAASMPASAMEDDYGEISIDSSGPATPLPITTGAPAVAAVPRPSPSSPPTAGVRRVCRRCDRLSSPACAPAPCHPGGPAPCRFGRSPARPCRRPACHPGPLRRRSGGR